MVRSSNPNKIFRDIEKTLGRTVNNDIKEINKLVKARTPYKDGHAHDSWKIGAKYKLGDSKVIIRNTADYIAVLDYGSSPGPDERPTFATYIKPHSGPSRPYATKGIVQPVLDDILSRNKKI